MATILNRNWDSSAAALFCGEELGLADYVNILFKRLEELALLQRSQFWVETEISMDADKKQWGTLNLVTQEITLLNLGWQTMADSFITRAPESCIAPLVSRPELEGMLIQWSYFENIHSRAYSNFIRNVLPNPSEFIDSVMHSEEAFARIASSIDVLDKLAVKAEEFCRVRDAEVRNTVLYEQVREETMELLLEAYFAIYALEAMMFYASFSCTFALAENDILLGLAKTLQLIAKDEALHTVMSKEIITILYQQMPADVVERVKRKAPQILRQVLQTEINWGRFLFDGGRRKIIGLNEELLEEYLYYIGRLAFEYIGIPWPSDLPVITKHPIPWIEFWLKSDKQQVAPQEIQLTNYRVGQIESASEEAVDDLNDEFEGMF